MKWYIEGFKEGDNRWHLFNTYQTSALTVTPAKARDALNNIRAELKKGGWKKVYFDTKHRE